MARLAIGALMGVVVGIVGGAALGLHAQTVDDETTALAHAAGLDPTDLAGALSSQPGVDARAYLAFLTAPETAGSAQAECIIQRESGGSDVYNRQGSGATGPGQYMPSTWRAHTLEMGMPWLNIHSLPDVRRVVTYDLAMGRRRQWTVGGC